MALQVSSQRRCSAPVENALAALRHAVVARIEMLPCWRHPASEAGEDVEAVRASGGTGIGVTATAAVGNPDSARLAPSSAVGRGRGHHDIAMQASSDQACRSAQPS